MSETQTVETEQAAREASGSHPYGRYLEEFEVGAVYKHWPAKTVTESDDHLFCLITMNHHPLHLNDVYARKSQQGRNVVVGPLVYSLALGMSVSDVSGKAIANLATEELSHPAPVFHGDTLYCESEVLEKKESRSKPDRGTVKVHTRVLNQDGVLVAEFKRLVLVPRKNPGAGAAEADGGSSREQRRLGPARRRPARHFPREHGTFLLGQGWSEGSSRAIGSVNARRGRFSVRRPSWPAPAAPTAWACKHDRDMREPSRRHEYHRPRPHQERAPAGLGGRGGVADRTRRYLLVRRVRRGVRQPLPGARGRRYLRAALGGEASELLSVAV